MNEKEKTLWVIDKTKTKDFWLELKDPEGWYKASVKWDGCIHFIQYGNVSLPEDPERKSEDCCDDYLHICNLDGLIERLCALREHSKEFFISRGRKWPG